MTYSPTHPLAARLRALRDAIDKGTPMPSPTTREVWSALPYAARRALIPADLVDMCDGIDLDTWTPDRIQVTPWTLLPSEVREAIHTMVTCADMG